MEIPVEKRSIRMIANLSSSAQKQKPYSAVGLDMLEL